jgi:hypothetical protein
LNPALVQLPQVHFIVSPPAFRAKVIPLALA